MCASPVKSTFKNSSYQTALCLHSPGFVPPINATSEAICYVCANKTLSDQKKKMTQIQRQKQLEEDKQANERLTMELELERQNAINKKIFESQELHKNHTPLKEHPKDKEPEKINIPDLSDKNANVKKALQQEYKEQLDKQIASKHYEEDKHYNTSLEGFSKGDEEKSKQLAMEAKASWIEDLKRKGNKKKEISPVGYIFREEVPHNEENLSECYEETMKSKIAKKRQIEEEKKKELEILKKDIELEKLRLQEEQERKILKSRGFESDLRKQSASNQCEREREKKMLKEWGSNICDCQEDILKCSQCKRIIKKGH